MGGWTWTLQEIKGWDLYLRLWLCSRLEGPSVPGWKLGGGAAALDWRSPGGTLLVLRSVWSIDFEPLPPLACFPLDRGFLPG